MENDLISRQAAIRWVKTECNPYGKPTLEFESGKKVIEHLEQMPSAEPEYTTEMQESDIDEAMKLVRDARVTILPSVQLEIMSDGTLHITATVDVANINRILLSQEGTHLGALYYKDE